MRIHSVLQSSSVNGPGNRVVVWLQGCVLSCGGCWNKDTWSSTGGTEYSWKDLRDLVTSTDDVEGVTFSGGEPMQQAQELSHLIEMIKRSWPECTFGMYTGYTKQELCDGNYFCVSPGDRKYKQMWWNTIQRHLDFAVMGRFNQDQLDDSRPLCSSRNQKLVLFSDRYKLEDFRPQEYEVFIGEGGLVQLTGFPPPEVR